MSNINKENQLKQKNNKTKQKNAKGQNKQKEKRITIILITRTKAPEIMKIYKQNYNKKIK